MKFSVLVMGMLVVSLLTVLPVRAQNTAAEELLRLHGVILQAHIDGDVDAWMAVEADTVFQASNGDVRWLSRADRRPGREAYLTRATFDVYRDVSPPVVRVSTDGSMGWVLAEVEISGWMARDDGAIEDFATRYAWIETWEKRQGEWKMTGNISNSRDLD